MAGEVDVGIESCVNRTVAGRGSGEGAVMTEFERGWQAALQAAKAWHEGKAKQILVQAGRSRFPKSLEQQAQTHRLAAEVLPTLTPDVTG